MNTSQGCNQSLHKRVEGQADSDKNKLCSHAMRGLCLLHSLHDRSNHSSIIVVEQQQSSSFQS